MPDGMRGKPCTLCEAPDARICERCKSARYCSVDCQSDDWKVHKLLCKSFSKFDMSERPSEHYFRAIVFPHNVSKPELVWIYCQWLHEPGLEWQEPNAAPFLCDWGTPAGILVETDAILQRNLPNPIVIYTQNERLEGSSSTRSVSAVVATIPGYSNYWRGPIVAVGKKMHNGQPIACRDLDMEDFRYIADFLIAHRRWSRDVPGPTTDFVKGVRMNCDSDCKVFNKPRFEPVDVPSTDPIFGVSCEPESEMQWNDTSDIADRIGLSLLTRRLPPSLRRARLAYGDFQNQDATQLHLCCDPTANGLPIGYGSSPGFGWAGWKWQSSWWRRHASLEMSLSDENYSWHSIGGSQVHASWIERSEAFRVLSIDRLPPERGNLVRHGRNMNQSCVILRCW